MSVIIPVYAEGLESVNPLRLALQQLDQSEFQDFEVLVADDCSPDAEQIEAIVREAGAQLVRLGRRSGPAAARNAAARKSCGEILTFLDADTSVHPDTLQRIAWRFREDPGLDSVMGSYDWWPTDRGVVSQFRNLLHSFVHQRSSCRVQTFWAGCGAVRKTRFDELGGFDEEFSSSSIEDVEFGLRLHESGGTVELDREVQVTHHKCWTLGSMVRTDLFRAPFRW